MGDITDRNLDWEYAVAKPLMKKMDDVVPYSVLIGNHDKKARFTKWFPYSEYKDELEGSYDDTMLNTYRKLHIRNII